MKKCLVLVGILSIVMQVTAQDVKLTVGAEFGVLPGFYENQTVNDYQGLLYPPGTEIGVDMSYSALSIRAFFDFTYGVISLGYHASASPMTVKLTVAGSGDSGNGDFSNSNIELRVLGKYPFHYGSSTISPLIGLEWAPCLDGQLHGIKFDSQTKSDYSDFSILGGLMSEVNVARDITARHGFFAGYVLTSQRGSAYYSGVRYIRSLGWFMEITLGFGYRI